MQIKRLRPEQGAAKAIIDASKKIKHLETRPAGTIVITDKLIARDPETGVETILGHLPDGSFGLQPNINDTVPPNKPSTPKTEPALGAVSLTWDGKDSSGADQPRDYARTEVVYRKIGALSEPYVLGGIFYDANTVLVSGLTSDVPYEFRLISYDTNGNVSDMSGVATGTPANFVDNTDVADALADVRKEAQDATSASASAQSAAAKAQETATTAAEEAARAAGLAANGSGVIFSPTAPTDAKDRSGNKLWIDTSGTPAKNTPNRWDGGKWVAVTDKAALDAAAKATAAETAADLAAESAASAAGLAGEAQKAANGKNRVWYRDAAPAGNAHAVGDTWFDSANGNVPKIWTGAAWASAQDASIATAKSVADSAMTTANGKNAVFYQTDQPASTTAKPLKQGDLWFDTDGNYAQYTYSGSAWIKTQDSAAASKKADDANSLAVTAKSTAETAVSDAADAASAALEASNLAASKGKVLAQPTAPTGVDANAQTLWIDTTNNANTPKRWNVSTSAWVTASDKVATDAASLAATKGKVLIQSTAPGTADQLTQNLWIDTTGNLNKPKRWNSTTKVWDSVTDKAATDAASAAAQAQADATKAITDASNAAVRAGDALTAADGKATVRYAATAPSGTAYKVNDLWFDSANGNKPMRWDGAKWVSVADGAIKTALDTADGKSSTYWESTKPTGGTYKKGDTWFDTANNYALWTHNGTTWVKAQDSATARTEAITVALAATARGANVIVNGGFEQDFTGWEKEVTQDSTNYGIDTTVSRSGGRSFFTTKNGGFRQDPIPVKAGETWEFSLWYKTDDLYSNSNAGGLRLQAVVGGAWADVASTTLKSSPTEWVQSSTRYVIPVGVTQIRARFAFNYSGGAKVWVDDISLVNITAELAAAADATAKANAAQSAAITAAQADAKAQTEAAEARVALVAAADAKKKADDAQTAALAAAKTYADTQASGAGSVALEAAKRDATEKANAAQAAAIAAADLDATAKAEEAEANAALEAKRLADLALEAAKSDATTKVATKTKTWIQTSRPALTGNVTGDTWIDTSTAGGNKLNIWNGSAWVSAQDAAIATAKSVADSKNKTYYQNAKPTGGIYVVGDTWFDTANNYALYTYTAPNVWTKTQDAAQALADAKTDATAKANAAQSAAITAAQADAKAQTEAAEARVAKAASDDAQAKATAAQTAALAAAKTYADAQASGAQGAALEAAKADATEKANAAQAAAIAAAALDATAKKEEAERVAAVEAQRLANVALEAAKTDAATKVATKNKTWIQTSRPALTGNITGDTWIDTSTAGGNKLNVWDGSAWVAAQDTAIATAQSAAGTALTAANGKNKIIFSTSDASGTTGYTAGDMWMKRDAAGTIIGQWEFTTSWQKRTIAESVLGNLSAGKITSGTIAADRIGANTIGVTKLSVADLTNLLEDPLFTQALPSPYWTGSITDITAATDHPTVGTGNTLKITGTASIRDVTSTRIACSPGDEFYAEVWVKPLATGMKGSVQIASTVNLVPSGSTWPSFAQLDLSTLTPNVWTKISGSIKTPSNAKGLFIRLSLRENVASGDVLFAAPALRRKNGGELLVDGAIKAGSAIIADGAIGTAQIGQAQITTALIKDGQITNAKINDLNASKINAGTIAADRIGANSINATKLVLTDTSNLWPNQYLSDELSSVYGIGSVYTGTEVPPLGKCRLLNGRDHIAPAASYINARYGDSFTIEAVVKRTMGDIRLGAGLWMYKSAGVVTPSPYRYTAESVVVDTLANGWERRRWTITFGNASDVDATLGLLYFQIEQATTNATTNWLVSDITVRRRNGGELLVDGTIKAGSAIIAEGAIGTAQIGDAQITNAKIKDLNASKITAGTIAADRIDANTVRAKLIAADDINAADILVSGSITSASGVIGELDAAVITSGYINAERIKAGSLTIGAVQGLQTTVDAAAAANSTVTSWKGSDGKVNAANVTGTLAATVPGAKVSGAVPVDAVPALPTSKVTNLDSALTTASNTTSRVDGWTFAGTTEINGGSIRTDTITATQIKAASLTSASGVFGDINASSITSGTIAADRLVANDIRAKIIAADDINAVDIIASNSITAASGIIGSIDAGVITVGTLNAGLFKSKSIGTDKLIISSSDNVIQEPDFSAEGVSWGRTSTVTYVAGAGRGGGNALRFTGTTLSQTSMNNQPKLPVDPDASYRGLMWVKSNAALPAGRVKLLMRCFTTATAYTDVEIAANTAALVAGTWTEISGPTTATYGKVPANTINVSFIISVVNTSSANVTEVDYVSATRKSSGKLIVDGAIDGQTITGALIQSVSAANRGIKLNASQFVAYNDSGVETLRLDGSRAVITGATVQTAATGARVVLDTSGLRAFPASGTTPYLSATSDGLSLTGTLTTVGTSTTRPGSVISTIVGPTPINGGLASKETVPGIGFYNSSDTGLLDSPPSVASSDGRAVVIRGAQKTATEQMSSLISVGEEIYISGDTRQDGRISQSYPVGRHIEFSGSFAVPRSTVVVVDSLPVDIAKSPGYDYTKYRFASFSGGKLTFRDPGIYLVSVKTTMNSGPTGQAYHRIYEDGWVAQTGYYEVGGVASAWTSGQFFMGVNTSLTIDFAHSNTTTVTIPIRVKVTLLT